LASLASDPHRENDWQFTAFRDGSRTPQFVHLQTVVRAWTSECRSEAHRSVKSR
jgi:hypothetical protein